MSIIVKYEVFTFSCINYHTFTIDIYSRIIRFLYIYAILFIPLGYS